MSPRHQRRAARMGVCYDCGCKEPGGYRCAKCRERVNEQRRKSYAEKDIWFAVCKETGLVPEEAKREIGES